MAGIYIHIPFCKKKCHYCNFYSLPTKKYHDELIAALLKEMILQKSYLEEPVETIYFGGGTPSLLSEDDVKSLIGTVEKNYTLISNPEITIEVNPDDISLQKVRGLKTTDVNRISIGVQSFFQQDLTYLNRIHTSEQSEYAIKTFQDSGYSNISIDLIYGMPSLGTAHWKENLLKAIDFQIPHISAYAITVEPGTNLERLISLDKRQPVSDAEAAAQFRFVMNFMRDRNYIHYEISNFCLPGMESKHNKAYWENSPYLGIGPSAHSYNQVSRQWNCANLEKYISAINNNEIPSEKELLSDDQKYNEFVMMGFRTNRGNAVKMIEDLFGEKYAFCFRKVLKKYEDTNMLDVSEDIVRLSDEGKLFADSVIADFFYAK